MPSGPTSATNIIAQPQRRKCRGLLEGEKKSYKLASKRKGDQTDHKEVDFQINIYIYIYFLYIDERERGDIIL